MALASYLKIGVLTVLALLSAFFSASEAALFSLGFYRVRRLKTNHPKAYRAAQKLLREPTKLISTVLTGNELVNTSIGVVSSVIILDYFGDSIDLDLLPFVVVGMTLPILLIFGEIIPKTLGMKSPEKVSSWVAVPLAWFSDLVAPIRNNVSRLSDFVLKITGKVHSHGDVSEEMFRAMVDTGHKEGVLEAREQQLIHNVFKLDDVLISNIMTPKERVSFLRSNKTLDEAVKQFQTEKYSRFPVLSAEGNRVEAVLHVKDLLGDQQYQPTDPITKLTRSHLTVKPTMNALELFIQFRQKKTHFAVVTDEKGDMVGVVTLDNVLEQIFGAFRDERDLEEGGSSKL